MAKLKLALVVLLVPLVAHSDESLETKIRPNSGVRRMECNFGCCVGAYDVAVLPLGVRQLDLTQEEVESIRMLRTSFEQESEFQDTRSKYRNLSDEEYFERAFMGEEKFAEKLNRRILSDIDEVLGDRRRKTRYRQLLTQYLLKWLDFEAISRLHEIDLDWETYDRVEKQVRKDWKSETDPRFLHEAIMNDLEQDGHLTTAESQVASGDIVAGLVPVRSRSIDRTKIDGDFIQAPIRLIRSTRVHRELKLKASKASDAFDLGLKLSSDSRKNRIKIEDVGKEEFYLALQRQRDALNKRISEFLTEEQYKRFRQLLFQFHTERMQLGWALYAAGKPFDPNLLPERGSNDVAGATAYAWQVDQKLAGLRILSDLVGDSEARRMCGKLMLAPSVAHAFSPVSDQKIRDRMTKLFIEDADAAKKRVNPRRQSEESPPPSVSSDSNDVDPGEGREKGPLAISG